MYSDEANGCTRVSPGRGVAPKNQRQLYQAQWNCRLCIVQEGFPFRTEWDFEWDNPIELGRNP